MAQFYILPPREHLEHLTQEWFGQLVPGVPVPDLWHQLQTWIEATEPEVVLLHREEILDPADDAELVDVFGATAGDWIHQVSWPNAMGGAAVRSRIVPDSIPESLVQP